MKKIITIVLASAALFIGTQAHAQFSINAGSQHQTVTSEIAGVESTDNLNAFYVGAAYNIRFGNGFGLAPSAYYSYAFENKNAVLQKDQSITIPLMFNYGLEITDWLSAALAVGPTGSFAFGSQGVETKTFNLGIGSALVFTFAKHLALNSGYEYGFLNRYNGPASGASLKTAKLNFGISYLF